MPGHSAAITSSTSPVHLTSASDNHHPSNFNSTSSRSLRPRSITNNSSATMGRTTAKTEVPLPITFTPTTHRISKAKKGKRVHACEFPGCNKVFTRAEHRRYAMALRSCNILCFTANAVSTRRHELNHDPEARYSCTYDGCKRAFHRQDLLSRHMERQYVRYPEPPDASSVANLFTVNWKCKWGTLDVGNLQCSLLRCRHHTTSLRATP